jgi:thymidylate synthase (FAD)
MGRLLTEELTIPDSATVVLEPHGFVDLQDFNASDLDVVNAARVSFNKQSEWGFATDEDDVFDIRELKEDDEKVLRYLLRNRHGTPFEHTYFKWHIRAPIFVFREWHRHRIGISINEESGRYVELKPDFYVPEGEAIRSQSGKAGRYTFDELDKSISLGVQHEMERAYHAAYGHYKNLMRRGVAKEVARAVLPVGIYSQMIWTCNARSLMNFLRLRNHSTALYEIRVYAEAMEDIFQQVMPVTHDAFLQAERTAP